MSCQIPKWPVASEGYKLAGRSWLTAVESLIKLSSSFPLVVLLGRAGMGKSQAAMEACRRSQCIYIDLTEAGERNMATVAALVAWRILSTRAGVKNNKLVNAYKKFGYDGLYSLAKADPIWTLRSALELADYRQLIVLDEFLPSAEDPKFFEVAYVLHRIRNSNLPNVSFIVTMLPEVYEKIVEKIPPLGNLLTHVTVQLPDVIPEDEVAEIVEAYCPEKAELAAKILAERPDLTVRELLLELNNIPSRRYVELKVAD